MTNCNNDDDDDWATSGEPKIKCDVVGPNHRLVS